MDQLLSIIPSWSITIVVIYLCVMLGIAVLRGQSVQFWPPKIGERKPKEPTKNSSSDKEKKNIFQHRIKVIPPIEAPSPTQQLNVGLINIYPSLTEATDAIKSSCKEAEDIKIISNKGLVFFGTDESIISTVELDLYKNIRKIRILLLSPKSRWINNGLVLLRKHISLKEFIRDIEASHEIIAGTLKKFIRKTVSSRSGVRLFNGEPVWRLIMTEESAFVSSYADKEKIQVRDLPVYHFKNAPGSLYGSFKRHFNNIWHNDSSPSNSMADLIDFNTSAGGVVFSEIKGDTFILLLQRHDNFWVLPKGHKEVTDASTEEAAIREVSEETGIIQSNLNLIEHLETYTDTTYEEDPKIIHLYSIKFLGTELPPLKPDIDHKKGIWWRTSSSMPAMYYPYQAATIEEFINNSNKLVKQKNTCAQN